MTEMSKWRPPLAMIIAGLVGVVAGLPLLAMAVVVSVSRAPEQIALSLLANWPKIGLALVVVVLISGFTGYIFWRGLAGPLKKLTSQAEAVTKGADTFPRDGFYGTQEVAQLATDFSVVVERLQKRSQYLETLSAHLAHELKSPLTSIHGAAELLRDQSTEMEEAQRVRFLENIMNDTNQLTALSSGLRDLARADMSQSSGIASLYEITDGLVKAFPDLEFVLIGDNSATLPLALGDALIVLNHLAENAKNQGAKQITIDSVEHNLLEVSNDGVPMAEENKSDIFTPFFTTRRGDGGTGLGLAISRALVTAHGGEINLSSSDPVCFQIDFREV